MTSQDDHPLVLGADGRRLDRIELRGLAAQGWHGVHDHERRDGQRFVADVVVHLDTRRAAAGDDLGQTVNYGVLARQVVAVLGGEPVDLLETLAERIAATVLADPQVQAVDVSVHKPQAPLPLEFADVVVSIRRDRTRLPAAEPYDAIEQVAAPVPPAPQWVAPAPPLVPVDLAAQGAPVEADVEDEPLAEPATQDGPFAAEPLVAGAPLVGSPVAAPLLAEPVLAEPVLVEAVVAPTPAAPIEVAPPVELAPVVEVPTPVEEPAAGLAVDEAFAEAPERAGGAAVVDAPALPDALTPADGPADGAEPLPASVDWIPDPEQVSAAPALTPPWPRRDGAEPLAPAAEPLAPAAETVAEPTVEPVAAPPAAPAVAPDVQAPLASQAGAEPEPDLLPVPDLPPVAALLPDLGAPLAPPPVVAEPSAPEPFGLEPPEPVSPVVAPVVAATAPAVVEPLPPAFAPSAPPSPPHVDVAAIVVPAASGAASPVSSPVAPAPGAAPAPFAPVTDDDDAVLDRLPNHLVDVVVALGGNVGPVLDTLRWAVQRLRAVPGLEVTAVGPLARTAAVGVTDQPDFLNTVVLARCLLPPRELLHRLRAVEQEAGRERHERWGPRTLDLDLVVYGTLAVVTDELELPHPRAHERAFVLAPWAAVDPGAVLPGLGGGPVAALAATAPDVAGLSWVPGDWLAPDGSQAP